MYEVHSQGHIVIDLVVIWKGCISLAYIQI